MQRIDHQVIEQSMTYAEYRRLIEQLLHQNKTTGPNQSAAMLHYTTMNVVRMERLDKKTTLSEAAQQILSGQQRPLTWLVLTEAWCGDAAQVIPVLEKMAARSEYIELRLLLRDEHPALMDAFLTDGSRSIPKLIVLDAATLTVLGTWGPRPAEAQRISLEGKAELSAIKDAQHRKERFQELAKTLQKWYARDKTQSIQREVLQLIKPLAGAVYSPSLR